MKKIQTTSDFGTEPSVAAFVDAARRYCALIERRGDLSRGALVARIHCVLAELYFRGVTLPEVQPNTAHANRSALTDEAWRQLFTALRDQLQDYDSYWVADAHHDAPANSGESSLSDDLADVYRDMKSGLALWDAHEESNRVDAIWEWRDGFRSHWGAHALNALARIHSISCEDESGEPGQDV